MFKFDTKTLCVVCILLVTVFMMSNGVEMMSDLLFDHGVTNRYGTVNKDRNRWENLSQRPEGCGSKGHSHFCRNGPPSKLTIDRTGSHHALYHMCNSNDDLYEPEQLGNGWWRRKSCANVNNVGVNNRPSCSQCGDPTNGY